MPRSGFSSAQMMPDSTGAQTCVDGATAPNTTGCNDGDDCSYGDVYQFAPAGCTASLENRGTTPLKLSMQLQDAGIRILGTSPDSIDLAEDRKRFGALLDELGIPQPENHARTRRRTAPLGSSTQGQESFQ